MKRIHIVGCSPRSGTTLMLELMKWGFDIDQFANLESRISKKPKKPGKFFLTKSPKDVVAVEPVLRLNKNLFIIYMVRDPRDIIVSKHGLNKEQYWCGLRSWKLYTPYADRMLGHKRFITIKYEDLVNRPNDVQTEILEKIEGLNLVKSFADYNGGNDVSEQSKQAMRNKRRISASSIGNWKQHLPRVKQQLKVHGTISQELIKYGYETDNNWEMELESAPEIDFESHLPEHYSKKELKKLLRLRSIRAFYFKLFHFNPIIRIMSFFLKSQ